VLLHVSCALHYSHDKIEQLGLLILQLRKTCRDAPETAVQ
jgi:hypothetical protein